MISARRAEGEELREKVGEIIICFFPFPGVFDLFLV